ncbi:phasin family protein [Afifella sp. IM 167]|uniref:phasin family protein n=1 Tax=Afifella sp. IM 167 TaxID=2033586 RepID=UPI001CC9DA39|nr:phasin family protein [Afifella sp. IM 167]MBZ8132359.1 Phasin [Afifella sp. IM 167]
MNAFDDFQKMSMSGMDKAMESFGVVSKRMQEIAVETADFSKKSFETTAAHVESMMAVKSLDKAIEAQSDYVKSSYEGAVAQATRIGELYVDLAKDMAKPFEDLAKRA